MRLHGLFRSGSLLRKSHLSQSNVFITWSSSQMCSIVFSSEHCYLNSEHWFLFAVSCPNGLKWMQEYKVKWI